MDPRERELWLRLLRAQFTTSGGIAYHLQAQWPGKSLADLKPADLSRLLAQLLDDPSTTPGLDGPAPGDLERGLRQDEAWLQGGPERHLLPLTDPRYPCLLRQIPDPPAALFVLGNPEVLAGPCLSIVGARNATPQGREIADSFARDLADRGLVIVSGLARGIDGCAHQGALETGATVAVCGHGLDTVYPAVHRALAQRISAGGALVSEFPAGIPPRPLHFPRRNRLISGLSLGTLVVEAGLRSGSLITARLAAEQNREVFAVPGSVYSPQSKGCHALIKKGVTLVESLDDIFGELGGFAGCQRLPGASIPERHESVNCHAWFLDCMGFAPCTRDELVKRSGLTSAEVSSMLLGLELEGCVQLCPGGTYVRVNRS